MAKKKAKKKAARKGAAKKKATAKKRGAKSRRTTRNVAPKTKRTPARRKAASRKRTASPAKPVPKTFTVNPDTCKIVPDSQHVEPKSRGGSVQFNATNGCTLEFDNPSVLDIPSNPLPLATGPNGPYDVAVEKGMTNFKITDCSREHQTSDPSDIIVP